MRRAGEERVDSWAPNGRPQERRLIEDDDDDCYA